MRKRTLGVVTLSAAAWLAAFGYTHWIEMDAARTRTRLLDACVTGIVQGMSGWTADDALAECERQELMNRTAAAAECRRAAASGASPPVRSRARTEEPVAAGHVDADDFVAQMGIRKPTLPAGAFDFLDPFGPWTVRI